MPEPDLTNVIAPEIRPEFPGVAALKEYVPDPLSVSVAGDTEVTVFFPAPLFVPLFEFNPAISKLLPFKSRVPNPAPLDWPNNTVVPDGSRFAPLSRSVPPLTLVSPV
jgi:hypothetical protein